MNVILTTPCYCEFAEGNSANENDRYGDVCFFHGEFCLPDIRKVHYVHSLCHNTKYSWSCCPITQEDVDNGSVKHISNPPHPRSEQNEGADHVGPPISLEESCGVGCIGG